MEKQKAGFREDEECICDGKPCSCNFLAEEVENEQFGFKEND